MTRESFPPRRGPLQGVGRLYEPEPLTPIEDDGDHLDCAKYWNSYVLETVRPGRRHVEP